MAEFPLWAAISTVKQGLSARAGLASYRAGGGSVGDGAWFKMVSVVRDNAAKGLLEPTKPLDQRPLVSDIGVMPTKTQTGYLQNVTVITRDKVTGTTRARPYSVRTDDLMTRADVIATALDVFQRNAFGYEEITTGAIYSGTLLLTPGAEL